MLTLDIGCGPVNRADVRLDCVKSKTTNILASAEYLPFREQTFDKVLSSACFEHLANPTRALKDLKRVLKDNGKALVEVPKPQYTNQAYYHLFRFFGDLIWFGQSLKLRELRWLHKTLRRAKTTPWEPLVHKSIITPKFIQRYMMITKQEPYAPMFLLPLDYYISKIFKRFLPIALIPCSVKYTLKKPNDKVDVILPLKGSNPHLQECLESCYQTIPVNRLIVGDGGLLDKRAMEILTQYSPVTILDHTGFKTQGYSIRKLIEEVTTEYFVYLHSDVVLPQDWYQQMNKHLAEFDFFECYRMGIHPDGTMEPLQFQHDAERAYSGSQMGRTEAVKKALACIEDDYVVRTEDIVIQQRLEKLGFRYGKTKDTYHLHFLKKDTLKIQDHVQTILSFTKYLEPTKENQKVINDNIKLLYAELNTYC